MDNDELNCRIELALGDDLTANNDKRIKIAVQLAVPEVIFPGSINTWQKYSSARTACNTDWLKLWNSRHGKPWQLALEAYMFAYRTDPRDFATNMNLCMEPLWVKMRERLQSLCGQASFGVSLYHEDAWSVTAWDEENHLSDVNGEMLGFYFKQYKTPSLAICHAFLEVMEAQNGD